MCLLITPTSPLPGMLLVIYSVAVAQELSGTGPWCAGCTLALCWSALPGSCLTASHPAWCGALGDVAKAEVYYPCVTDRDPAYTEV